MHSIVHKVWQDCALRKNEGSLVSWTCKIQGARHMISILFMQDFLVTQEQ